jgi:hypothetical protein
MTSLARASLALTLSVAAVAAIASPAAGDGPPVDGVYAAPLTAPGGDLAYTTRRARGASVVEARATDSERLVRSARLHGAYVVSAVAYDGSSGGLSADGRTLVLASPRRRFPRSTSGFAVLDAERLRLRRVVRLRGDFSFDALSPDGSLMYLIKYLSAGDLRRYRVRVYDLRRGGCCPGRSSTRGSRPMR